MSEPPRRRRLAPRVAVRRDGAAEAAADRAARGERPGRRAEIATERADPALNLAEGRPLARADRRYFERRLGTDLGAVRLHAEAGVVADLGARALASGRDIAFAPGHYLPGSAGHRQLLGHELAHVAQQSAAGRAVQLDNGGPLEEAKPQEAVGALEGGVKTMGEQAAENEAFKAYAKAFAARHAEPIWNSLSPTGKGAAIGFGAATYALGVSTALASEKGRAALSDVNLAMPLKAIPYATLQSFSFVPPASATEPLTLRFGFAADDLLKLIHDKAPRIPAMTLGFDMTMTVNPDGSVGVPFALAHLGVMPGLDIQAGFGVTTTLPPLQPVPGGGLAPVQTFPQAAGPGGVPSTAVFVTIDVLKLPIVPAAVRRVLGAMPDNAAQRDR